MKVQLAALLALFVCFGCSPEAEKSSKDKLTPKNWKWNEGIKKFSNCTEISDYVASFWAQTYEDALMPGASPVSNSSHYQNQVESVSEGDLLQKSQQYFFFARTGAIEVVNRASLTTHKSIPVVPAKRQQLLYENHKLIYWSGDAEKTFVKIYNEFEDFKVIYEKTFIGIPVEFRLTDSRIVLVSYFRDALSKENNLDCSQIYRPNLEDGSSQITFVSTIDLKNNTVTDHTQGFLGGTDFIYMTQDELFLFKNSNYPQSHFRILDLKTQTPIFRQALAFEGMVKDRWAVLKKEDHLLFATTSRENNRAANNKILVFGSDETQTYSHVSQSANFGENEDIRAVRYLDDKAYIVTFEKTDPLFIFDIKNPQKISLLSELKSPGFSTQLRELNDGIFGGLGYQVNPQTGFSWLDGLKFSLFDLQDPLEPEETQTLHWGHRGSYSEATFEPKALYYSAKKDRIIFPAVIVQKKENMNLWDYGDVLEFAGAVVLDFDGSKVKEVGRLSHQEWRESVCGSQSYIPMAWWDAENISTDIQRAIQIKGEVYTFSRFGVMRLSSNLQVNKRLEFRNSQKLCANL